MKIVISPDSFKGSLKASELCSMIETVLKQKWPHANILSLPLADGGEGTMETLVFATGGYYEKVNVQDPLNRNITASFGVLGDKKTAVIEVAAASGLPLLAEKERNPFYTNTHGTGELIKAALDKGFRRFIIGLGGSGTNDVGVGFLQALGYQFYDSKGEQVPLGGKHLEQIEMIDETKVDKRLKDCQFLVASDVKNPLCGVNGATRVFGAQKGATSSMIKELERGVLHFASVIEQHTTINVTNTAGLGAAGGVAAAFYAFLKAKIVSGIELVMEEVNYSELIEGASFIITGEGAIDKQTFQGKVIKGVCKEAAKKDIPVVAICGQLYLSQLELEELGLVTAFSIIKKAGTLVEIMDETQECLFDLMERMVALFDFFYTNYNG
ncbi:glycerate kinase [Alkalihalobacterium bogoriense]|uniref:glycerate kinase n=1 Tax=Alkalihalobacterium bogoriense TaxID=246272 RepID=UPI00047E93E4|nr:glycerate kinase [Alkalihalobacterium bogoriense]